jgi:hypothetical protein
MGSMEWRYHCAVDDEDHKAPMTVATGGRGGSHRTRFLRTCIAWCALVALAWPSLGPLPYVVHGFGEQAEVAGDLDHVDHHGIDASPIPGSPTHPDDHHCPECEVLKHLARCVLAPPTLAVLAPVVVRFFTRRIAVATPSAPNPVHVPPARAPPAIA